MGGGRARGVAAVNIIHLLVVVALVQSVFLLGIVGLLLANRSRSARLRAERLAVERDVAEPVQRWLVGNGAATDVATMLAGLGAEQALEQAILIATSRAAPTQREEFSAAIRDAPWVREVLTLATSRRWWRRLDAARLLAIVGTPRERDLLRQLLADPHPAVQGVAAASLPHMADLDAVSFVLEGLPERSVVVKLYQFSMLKDTWWLTTPALLDRLTTQASPEHLETWISLAEAIGTAELLERVCALQDHPDALVRIGVARAMKRYFHPAAGDALKRLLQDDDWRVRALAARSIGLLGDTSSIARLASAMGDAHWWVRFRAALSLAQLGETGRSALREAREGRDRYASEMATMVSGLSPGSVVELSEA